MKYPLPDVKFVPIKDLPKEKQEEYRVLPTGEVISLAYNDLLAEIPFKDATSQ